MERLIASRDKLLGFLSAREKADASYAAEAPLTYEAEL